jgi:hypothetical protein
MAKDGAGQGGQRRACMTASGWARVAAGALHGQRWAPCDCEGAIWCQCKRRACGMHMGAGWIWLGCGERAYLGWGALGFVQGSLLMLMVGAEKRRGQVLENKRGGGGGRTARTNHAPESSRDGTWRGRCTYGPGISAQYEGGRAAAAREQTAAASRPCGGRVLMGVPVVQDK